jgi:PhnB protein
MQRTTTFAPQLFIPNGVSDIGFYHNAFEAIELRRFSNDDGSIHVAELSIHGSISQLHEETKSFSTFSQSRYQGTTVLIGLFVPDVDAVIASAVSAGGELLSPPQDYDYGHRQAKLNDPFGHIWMIEAYC